MAGDGDQQGGALIPVCGIFADTREVLPDCQTQRAVHAIYLHTTDNFRCLI